MAPPPSPLFVTWDVGDRDGFVLRGCIGCLSPLPLRQLREYAITSSMKDQRFPPVRASELPNLRCSVSLLVDYEDTRSWDDWEVGKHGILIHFQSSAGRQYSATYLPEVAAEQGWSKEVCMESLIRKAGFDGAITGAFFQSLRVTRYQSSKVSVTYQEYREALAGAEGKDGGRGAAVAAGVGIGRRR